MDERIREAFAAVHAEEKFKNAARAAVTKKQQKKMASKSGKRRYVAVVASCLLVMLVGGGWVYATPTASIEIQAEPSLELTVNGFGRVIAVRDFDTEAEDRVVDLSVMHCHYKAAVQQILESQTMRNWLSQGENMEIVIRGQNNSQCEQILSCVESCVSGHGNAHCYRKGWQERGTDDRDEDTSIPSGQGHNHGQGNGHHGGKDR